jgi:hypothetical protein
MIGRPKRLCKAISAQAGADSNRCPFAYKPTPRVSWSVVGSEIWLNDADTESTVSCAGRVSWSGVGHVCTLFAPARLLCQGKQEPTQRLYLRPLLVLSEHVGGREARARSARKTIVLGSSRPQALSRTGSSSTLQPTRGIVSRADAERSARFRLGHPDQEASGLAGCHLCGLPNCCSTCSSQSRWVSSVRRASSLRRRR